MVFIIRDGVYERVFIEVENHLNLWRAIVLRNIQSLGLGTVVELAKDHVTNPSS